MSLKQLLKMNKRLLFVLLYLAAACTQIERNPVEKAISDKLSEVTPSIKDVYFQSLELQDSVSLADEIDYREQLFSFKCDVLGDRYEKFLAERKPKNAAVVYQDLEKARKIKDGIGELREQLADSLEIIKYYEYKFSAIVTTENEKIQVSDYYAFVTPDMKVLKYAQVRKGMRNGIGFIIPGYTEILKTAGMEESDIPAAL